MTEFDWQVAIAAYAYEVLDDPIMTDFSYDYHCRELAKMGASIPGFDDATGIWVQEMDLDLLDKVFHKARSYYPDHADVHLHQIKKALAELKIEYTMIDIWSEV